MSGRERGEGIPLFRRTDNIQQIGSSSKAGPGLQAMRQYAAETTATFSTVRPRTTGSVRLSITGARRQSTGSTHPDKQHHHRSSSGDISSRHSQQPHLTRNLTLGDLRWPASTAAAVAGAHRAGIGSTRDTGVGSGTAVRRGWQVGTTRGQGTGMPPRLLGDSGRRPSSPDGPSGGVLSRLPLLETSRADGHVQQQQQPSMLGSLENSELQEHGMSYGVSALKGHRPYMEDEYKVFISIQLPVLCTTKYYY